MLQELIDHAERVLRHAPGASLAADALHRAACAQCGVHLPQAQFLAELEALPHRFAVTDAPPLDPAEVWSPAEREIYAAALKQTAMAAGPIVSIPVRAPADSDTEWLVQRMDDGRLGPVNDVADVLRDSLLELLRAAGNDATLRNAIGGAVAELQSVYADAADRRTVR